MRSLLGATALLLMRLERTSALTQAEFDCPARQLAYEQASALLKGTRLLSGLQDVHDALQLTTACGVAFVAVPAVAPERYASAERGGELATLHVATTGSDAAGDGSASNPFLTLRGARDAARAKNDSPTGATVGTVAIAPGRYELYETLMLTPADNGMTFEASGEGVVISGGLALDLQLSEVPTEVLAHVGLPAGVMQAKLPAGTGRLPVLYEDSSASDPRLGNRLPWARTPNGQVETDLQPQNMAQARGEGSTPGGPSTNFSMHSQIDTPRRNNSVYPIYGRDFDPRDVRDGEIVGWQWHHVGGDARRFGDDLSFWNGTAATSMRFGDPSETIGANCSCKWNGRTCQGGEFCIQNDEFCIENDELPRRRHNGRTVPALRALHRYSSPSAE